MSFAWLNRLLRRRTATGGAPADQKAPARRSQPGSYELEDVYSTVLIHIHHLRDWVAEEKAGGRRWTDERGQVVDRDFGIITNLLEDFDWIKQQFETGVIRSQLMDIDELRAIRARIEEVVSRSDTADQPLHRAAAVVIDAEHRVLLVQHGPASTEPSGSFSLPVLPVDDFESPEMAAAAAVAAQTGLMVTSDELAPLADSGVDDLSVFYTGRYQGDLKAGSVVAPRWLDAAQCTKLEPPLAALILAALAAYRAQS